MTLAEWGGQLFGSNPSWDVLLYGGMAVVAVAAGVWGRARLIAILVSGYVAMALLGLSDVRPWIEGVLNLPQTLWSDLGVLVGLVVLGFALVQYAIGDVLEEDVGSVSTSTVLAVAVMGPLVSFLLTTRPEIQEGFAPLTQSLFASPVSLGLWLLVPLVLLAATRDL